MHRDYPPVVAPSKKSYLSVQQIFLHYAPEADSKSSVKCTIWLPSRVAFFNGAGGGGGGGQEGGGGLEGNYSF